MATDKDLSKQLLLAPKTELCHPKTRHKFKLTRIVHPRTSRIKKTWLKTWISFQAYNSMSTSKLKIEQVVAQELTQCLISSIRWVA